jgi:hypothetical protein
MGASPAKDSVKESAKGSAKGIVQRPRRLARREITDDDRAVAARSADRILGLHRLAVSPSEIARLTRTPVGAVEEIIRAPSPQGIEPLAVPAGTLLDRPTSKGTTEDSTALAELLGGSTEKGAYADTMRVMRETASTDLLSSFLREQLEEKRLANRQHRLEIERLERGGTPATGDVSTTGTVAILLPNGQLIHASAGDADAIRSSFARNEREDEVAKLRGELQAERDKNREDRWSATVRDLDRKHSEELRALESRLSHKKTLDDIDTDSYAATAATKARAQARVMDEVGDTLHERPHLGRELGELAHDLRPVVSPAVQSRVRTLLAGPANQGELVEQTPEEMDRALAELQASARAAEGRPPLPAAEPPSGGPSTTVPPRSDAPTSWSEEQSRRSRPGDETNDSGIDFG